MDQKHIDNDGLSDSQKSIEKASSEKNVSSKHDSSISEEAFEPRKTQKVKTGRNMRGHLKIQNKDIDSDLDEIRFEDSERRRNDEKEVSEKSEKRAIWDEIEFDDNEI